MDEQAVAFALKNFENVDYVVSLYSMNVAWVSERAARALGYTRDELMGKFLRDMMQLTPEEIVKMSAEFEDGANIHGDSRTLIKKDGSTVQDIADIHLFSIGGEPFVAVVNSSSAAAAQS